METSRELGQRLLRLKEQLEQKKAERTELQGQLKSVMEMLKKQYGVKTLEEARAKMEEMEREVREYETEIYKGLEKVEELFSEMDI
ncbi:hypothetical protein DRN85_08600 [Methanosarcinales archaeon]|nr:MAG: hypothetical protein DRN85_08600 [Methanosarcinales archaeon]